MYGKKSLNEFCNIYNYSTANDNIDSFCQVSQQVYNTRGVFLNVKVVVHDLW